MGYFTKGDSMQEIKSYTYDDIGLIPQVGSDKNASRMLIKTTRKFFEDIELELPMIVAPMDTVVNNATFVKLVAQYGGLAIFNRYMTKEKLYSEIKEVLKETKNFGVAIGLNENEKLEHILAMGVRVICVDIANGYSLKLTEYLNSPGFVALKNKYNFYLMTGNVATSQGFNNIAHKSPHVDGIRVGIGGGAVCTTSLVTGVGVGIATSIQDVFLNDTAKRDVHIIADGSIKEVGDIVKALALGADFIMSGYLFAKTYEAKNNGNYRGMASKNVQEEYAQYSSNIQKRTYVEGENVRIPQEYSIEDLMLAIKNALHSAGTYLNCADINKLKYEVDTIAIHSNNTINEKHTIHNV